MKTKAGCWYLSRVAAVLLLTLVFTAHTKAATASHTRADAVNWAQSQLGRGLDYDGYYGNQCVDLVKYYYDYLGNGGYAYGNACDYAYIALPPGWTRVYGGYQPGDIAVWKVNHSCNTCYTDGYGHVGIITGVDANGFNAVNQNFSGQAYCTLNWFHHSALQCAIRPDFTSHTHSYSSKVTKQPTCTAAGVKTFTCSCGSSYTSQVAATGHKYVNTTVAPTTTEKGYTLHRCSVCGSSYKDNYTDPLKASGGWYYCDTLPAGVTSGNYTIEYKNYYEKVQSSSPGSDWTKAGTVRNEWQNSGAPYTSNTDLQTSDSRVLVSTVYYHWCGPSMGNVGNYEQSGGYVHYDQIPADWVSAQYVGNDNGHPYYLLYWSNGAQVYCKTGDTCDGSWGWHGTRCRAWYKENTYQNRTKTAIYKYTKESGWTGSRDSSATKVSYRYKAKSGSTKVSTSGSVTQPAKSSVVQTKDQTATKTQQTAATQSTAARNPATRSSAAQSTSTQAQNRQNTYTYTATGSVDANTGKSSVSQTASGKQAKASLKKGSKFSSGTLTYTVTKGGTDGQAQVKVTGRKSSGTGSVTIPDTVRYKGVSCKVTAIGAGAFKGCKNLKKVTIGKNVKSIGAKAFYGCGKLTGITVKTAKLTSKTVGSQAFGKINKKAVIRVPGKNLKAYKKLLKAKGAGKSVKIKA